MYGGDTLRRRHRGAGDVARRVGALCHYVSAVLVSGLRDYGTAKWEGGNAKCDHKGKPMPTRTGLNERYFGRASAKDNKQDALCEPFRAVCGKCGARRIDAQLGLEATPDCGLQGFMRLRKDLTEVQRQYVVRRLLGVLDPDVRSNDIDGKE